MDSHIGEHLTSQGLRGGIMLTLGAEAQYIFFELRWMLMLAFVLIGADFWFGISESKRLNKPIRRSKAGRRTLNKTIDYLCYILVASFLGMSFGRSIGIEPKTLASIVLILCYGFEIDSIYSHICVLHGVKKGFSIWKLLVYLITLRFSSLRDMIIDVEQEINKE